MFGLPRKITPLQGCRGKPERAATSSRAATVVQVRAKKEQTKGIWEKP